MIKIAQDAFEHAFGIRPILTRSGGTLPIMPALAGPGDPDDPHRLRAAGEQRPLAERADARRVLPARRRHDPRSSTPALATSPKAEFVTPLAAELADDVLERFLRYVRIDTQSEAGVDALAVDREAARPRAGAARRAGGDRARRRPARRARLRLRLARRRRVGAGDRADRACRHVAGRDRHRRRPAGARGLRRRRDRAARRLERRARPGGAAAAEEEGRPRHRHDRRHDAARRRRQGRRRGDHGRGRLPEAESGATTHAPIRVCFTVDEEVAGGADHLDLERFGAKFAYTLDGAALGEIEAETFNASKVDDHDPRPLDAPRHREGAARERDQARRRLRRRAPARRRSRPETTEEREGFVHPTKITRRRRGGDGRADRPRPRRGEDGRARRAAAPARRTRSPSASRAPPSRSSRRSSTGTCAR